MSSPNGVNPYSSQPGYCLTVTSTRQMNPQEKNQVDQLMGLIEQENALRNSAKQHHEKALQAHEKAMKHQQNIDNIDKKRNEISKKRDEIHERQAGIRDRRAEIAAKKLALQKLLAESQS